MSCNHGACLCAFLVAAPRPQPCPTGWSGRQTDLTVEAGLTAALAGVDVIVHCASDSIAPGSDVDAARHLLQAASAAGVGHIVYISIVGIDVLTSFAYYAAKLEVEQVIAAGNVPFTVLRATQFHDFVANLLPQLTCGLLVLLPRGVSVQPVDVALVAARRAEIALASPSGRLPDLAGPEIRTLSNLAQAWLRATRRRAMVLSLPLPGRLFHAIRQGALTAPSTTGVGETWETWLLQHAAEPSRYTRTRAT